MIELEFRNFCGGRKTGKPGEKPSKGENQQQTQLTYDAESGNCEPEITVVRGERLAATPPILPQLTFYMNSLFRCFVLEH
jgi:hypothetical protein